MSIPVGEGLQPHSPPFTPPKAQGITRKREEESIYFDEEAISPTKKTKPSPEDKKAILTPEAPSTSASGSTGVTPEMQKTRISRKLHGSSGVAGNIFKRDLLKRNCSDIFYNNIKEVTEVLEKSIPRVDNPQWNDNYPKPAGENASSGTYFIKGKDGKTRFITKPSAQEAGMKDCPNNKVRLRLGIEPGHGPLREFIPSFFQTYIGCDFGVPEVLLMGLKHPIFGSRSECPIRSGFDLLPKARFRTEDDVSKLLRHSKDFQSFNEQVRLKICQKITMDKLNEIVKVVFNMSFDTIKDFQKFAEEKFSDIEWSSKLSLDVLDYVTKISPHLNTIWESYSSQKVPQESLVSVHRFVPDCESLDELQLKFSDYFDVPVEELEEEELEVLEELKEYKEIIDQISKDQAYKLLINMIFLNSDTSKDNILFQEPSPNLWMIDHAYCLPKPYFSEDLKGLKETLFDVFDLPGMDQKIPEEVKAKLLKINPDDFIEKLSATLSEYKDHYSDFLEYLDLDPEVLVLLKFNLLVVKKAVALDKSLEDIAGIFCYKEDNGKFYGGEIVQLLKPGKGVNNIEGKWILDELFLEADLNQIFSKPLSDRQVAVRPWVNHSDKEFAPK